MCPTNAAAASALLAKLGRPVAPLSLAFAVHVLARGAPGVIRIEQLKETLGANLAANAEDREFVAFVLFYCGSDAVLRRDDGGDNTIESIVM